MNFSVKVTKQPNMEPPEYFHPSDMQHIGDFAIETMKERLHSGYNARDESAKPLTSRYAAQKQKLGKQPIRDIDKTGQTLAALQVTEADSGHAHISVEGSEAFRKGLFNEYNDPWFGASDSDKRKIFEEEIEPIFAHNILEAFGR